MYRWSRSSHGTMRVRHVNYATWYDTCHVTQVARMAGQRGGILRARGGRTCTKKPR